MKKQEKTNVMRLLDAHGISYESHSYAGMGALAGTEVAAALGEDPARVFKTLVTQGKTGEHYVFVVPVERELSLKKAAAAVGEKSIAMIKMKELLPLTGYVHGGCSPIGMKKVFPTVFDLSAKREEPIFFSAGKIGYQVEVKLQALKGMLCFSFADLCE